MEGTRHQWPDLLLKYLMDTLSQDEWEEMERQMTASAIKRAELEVYTNCSASAAPTPNDIDFDKEAEWEKFTAAKGRLRVKRLAFHRRPAFRWLAAAVILYALATGLYRLFRPPQKTPTCGPCELFAMAGSRRTVACDTCVYLLSSDGLRWSLTGSGLPETFPPTWRLSRAPSTIRYMGEPPAYSPFRTADRQRQYIIDNAGRESYTVELPDGSRVILRGGSQLEMAAAFSPTQRRVVLSGEGFFAITQDAAHPFAVLTPGGVNTSVLGTRFNLAAYGEDSTRISLVEGAIAVSWKAQTTAVSPGEQAVVDMAAGISTKKMSAKALREESDWSNDIFEYHDMEIEDVIKELARQYRLTPHFEGEITEKTRISAICSKSTQKLRGILANLKLYTHGLRFDVQGSQITVIANKKRHQ